MSDVHSNYKYPKSFGSMVRIESKKGKLPKALQGDWTSEAKARQQVEIYERNKAGKSKED